jgi:hypothetical protein
MCDSPDLLFEVGIPCEDFRGLVDIRVAAIEEMALVCVQIT